MSNSPAPTTQYLEPHFILPGAPQPCSGLTPLQLLEQACNNIGRVTTHSSTTCTTKSQSVTPQPHVSDMAVASLSLPTTPPLICNQNIYAHLRNMTATRGSQLLRSRPYRLRRTSVSCSHTRQHQMSATSCSKSDDKGRASLSPRLLLQHNSNSGAASAATSLESEMSRESGAGLQCQWLRVDGSKCAIRFGCLRDLLQHVTAHTAAAATSLQMLDSVHPYLNTTPHAKHLLTVIDPKTEVLQTRKRGGCTDLKLTASPVLEMLALRQELLLAV